MKTVPKKLLSLTASALMLANAVPASVLSAAAAETAVRGDVNGDGKIDKEDRAALVELLGSTCETLFSEGDRIPYDISGDGFVDPRDLYALDCKLKDGTPFPEETGERIADTVTLALGGGACLPGEEVTLDLSVIDWTKDITGFEIMVYFDSRAFTFENASYYSAEGITVCEGEGIKLTGLYGDQSLWRGKLAALTFKAKGNTSGEFEFAIRGANLYTSGYDIYTSVKDTSTVDIDTLFAPTAPQLTGISSKSASLAWEMPFASEQAAGYLLFRDGKQIAETADPAYTDKGLTPDTDYSYSVQAKTAAGEMTEISPALTVHTAAPKIESVSFPAKVITEKNSTLNVVLAEKMLLSAMNLTFTAADGTKTEETVSLKGISASSVQYQWDVSKVQGGDYTVSVTVTDADGAKDTAETAVTVHTAAQAPAPVTVKATPGSRSVTLTWSIAQEADAKGYYVYQKDSKDDAFAPVAEIKNRATLSTVISGLVSGKEYTFAVTAYDVYGMESAMSEPVTAIPEPDTVNPEITYFIPATGQRAAGALKVEIRAKDDSAVAKIVCEIAPQPADSEAEPEYKTLFEAAGARLAETLDTTTLTDGNYVLRAMAYDEDGNASSGANVAVIQTDNTAPEKVSGLRTEAVYPTQATLAWDNVPDADFSYFRVIISNGPNVNTQTVRDKLGLNLSGLMPETRYSVTVCAVDQTGNIGPESDPIFFVTEADTTPPVITGFSVSADIVSPSQTLVVGVTATDTATVVRRMLQYSQDQKNWKTLSLNDITRSFAFSCTGMTDGPLYLRAYAQDSYGNAGNPEDAVIQTVTVDATAPEKPAAVTAEPNASGILVKWEKSPSEDAVSYVLQRAAGDSVSFTTLADKTASLEFLDKTAAFDTEYTYRVFAVDRASNYSKEAAALKTVRESDDVKPYFRDATISGSVVCEAHRTFQIIAQDNVQLAEVTLGLRLGDAAAVTPLEAESVKNESGSQMRLTAVLPDAVFAAESVTIIANAKDTAGNEAETAEYTYAVDNSKAVLSDLTVTPQGNTVLVSWKAAETAKTRAMYVYRKIGEDAEQAIASIRLDSTDGSYSYTDNHLVKSGVYVYRIYAVQQSGNSTSLTADAQEIHSVPKAKLICDTAQMVGAAYHFDCRESSNADEITAVTLDYGDGTVATADKVENAYFEHTYENIGTYDVVLTCKNAEGGEGTCTVSVTVSAPSELAEVTATVTATDGSAASYAAVYVDIGTDSQMKYETDEHGVVKFAATAGEHQIGVFGNGYLPETKTCTFVAGAENEISFSVVKNQLVDASFNITRMTLEEIKAAGINVADPANTHVVKINVQASYQSPDAKDDLSIIYDFDTGVHVVNNTDNRYRYIVQAVRTRKKEIETVVLLRIPAEVSFLKEFFNVEMVVINNASSEFSIENSMVSLNVPNGMTLMSDAVGSAAQTASLGTIRGGTTKSVNWILRGDVRGSYRISADFEGTLAGFDEHISQRFEADQPIEVRGREQATITVNLDTAIRGGGLMVEVLVENKSGAPLYNVSTDLGTPVVEAIGKFTGKASVRLYQTRFTGTDGILKVLDEKTNSIETLNPGESFSVLYRITDFSKEYAFSLLKYLRGTLDYSATSSNVKVQVTSDVRYVNVNSIYYGIKFDKNTQYLLAFRNKAGKELAGVNVSLYQFKNGARVGEITGTTDERGRLIVARQPAGESYYIRAELDGYKNYFNPHFGFPSSKGKTHDTFTMTGNLDEDDYGLTTASFFLNSSYTANLLTGHGSARRGDGDTISIRVGCNAEAEHFELRQDGSLIASAEGGTNVVFRDLDAYDFRIGKGIEVWTYAASGDHIETSLNLEILRSASASGAAAAVELAEEVNEQNNKQPITITNPEWSGEVGMDMTWSLPDFANIGNFDPDDSDPNEIAEQTGLDITASEGHLCIKLSHSIEIPLKGKDAGKVQLDKPNREVERSNVIYIVAYFQLELTEDTDNNTFVVDGALGVEFGGRAETTVFWTATPIPFYFSLTFELGGEISRHLTYTYDEKQASSSLEYHVDGAGHASVKPMLAIGQSDIAHVGIYGIAQLDVTGVMYTTSGEGPHFTKVWLTGTLGFECDILGWWGFDYPFLTGTCTIYDYEENQRRAQGRPMMQNTLAGLTTQDGQTVAEAAADTGNYRALTADDFAAAGKWNGSSTVLQEGVHVSAAPVLASDGKNAVLVWIAKDVTRGIPNASYAVYSVYDAANHAWSEPKPVDDNKNADLSPVLYADASGIRLAYQESAAVYDSADISIEDYAKGMVITAARFDAEAGKFTEFAQMKPRTEGAYLSAPAFCTEDGKAMLVCTENANGRIFGDDKTNAVLCAEITADGIAAPKALAENITAVTGLTAGTDKDGKAVIAYVTDDNSDFSDYYDRTLTVTGMDGKGIVLAQGRISAPQYTEIPGIPGSGEKGLVWYQDGSISCAPDLKTASVLLDGTDRFLTDRFITDGDRLLFTEAQENGNALCAAVWNAEAKRFESPVVLTSDDGSYLEHLTSANVGGETVYAAVKSAADITEDGVSLTSSLVSAAVPAKHDLTLAKAVFDDSEAAPGKALPLMLTVRNAGTSAAEKLTAAVTGEDGKVLMTASAEEAVHPGETLDIMFAPVLPEDFAPGKYTVTLSDGSEELTPEDNTAELDLSCTDLSVMLDREYSGDRTLVTIMVTNESCVPAAAMVHIRPQDAEEDTMTLISEEIAPHESAFWTIDSEDMLGENYHGFVRVTAESDIPDRDEQNNGEWTALTKGGFTPVSLGDVNMDGAVDLKDALYVLKIFNFIMNDTEPDDMPFSTVQRKAADVRGTGNISAADALMIQRYYNYCMMEEAEITLSEYLELLNQQKNETNGGAQS